MGDERQSTDPKIQALRGDIQRIGAKLDALGMLYVMKTEYDLVRASVDKRLDSIETEAKEGKQWANNEHSRLAETVIASERRIIDKLEEHSQSAWSNRQALLVIGITSLIGIAEFIINFILSHH